MPNSVSIKMIRMKSAFIQTVYDVLVSDSITAQMCVPMTFFFCATNKKIALQNCYCIGFLKKKKKRISSQSSSHHPTIM